MQTSSSRSPTPEELHQAIEKLTHMYQAKAVKMIDALYRNLIMKAPKAENVKPPPPPPPILEQKQSSEDDTSHIIFNFSPLIKKQPKDTHQQQQQVDVDEQLMTVTANHSSWKQFKHEVEIIQYYQQKLAAEMFAKHGYNLQLFRQEIHRQGGLFEVSESRYKNMTTNFISASFERLQKFLQSTGYNLTKINKVQIIAMHSILLNCNDNFTKTETSVFHKFIQLANDKNCSEIKVSRVMTVRFYEKAKTILQTKMEGERMIYLNHNFLPTPGRRARKLEPPLVDTTKSQKEIYEDCIVNLYVKYKKISDTQEQFEKQFGQHQQYSVYREVQAVIFKVCRRALRDIQQYCRQHHTILPQLTKMTDPKVKGILTSTKGLNTRCKLLVLAQSFKKKEKYVVINGVSINVTNWQVEPSQLNEVDLVLLMDLINEINKFFDGREGSGITLFDGKPPNYKVEKKRSKYTMDYDSDVPNGTKKRKKKVVFSKNFKEINNNKDDDSISDFPFE